MKKIELEPIGTIRTPFTDPAATPRGPSTAAGAEGRLEVFPEYAAGLRDLDGFSHLVVVFSFHRARETSLIVSPPHSAVPRGVFATRSPFRPNHLGISIVEIVSISGSTVTVRNVDMLDGTPLLDIKPYSPPHFPQADVRQGWMDEAGAEE